MNHAKLPLPVHRWLALLVLNLLFCAGVTAQVLNPSPGPNNSASAANQMVLIQIRAAQSAVEFQARRHKATTENERFRMDERLRASSEPLPNLVFLPVMPPALAAPQTDLPVPPYPAAFTPCVGESFFMTQGNLSLRRLLTPAQLQRIEDYVATRDQLVRELRDRLAATGRLPVHPRLAALAEFAATQQPALQKLETEAEVIRVELAELDVGTALINLRDDPKIANTAGIRDYFSAIFAAQFHDGLSLEQRQLLHEIALESLLDPVAATTAPPAFFSPASARIHWPEATDAPLADLRQRFNAAHQTLKAALKQSVLTTSGHRSATKRHTAYIALARQQAPQFDELHQLAEQIRVALADVAYPDRPAVTGLPPELIHQVGESIARKAGFQAEATRLFTNVSRELAPADLNLVFRDGQPVIEILPPANPAEKPAALGASAHTRLQETNTTLRRLHLELTAQLTAARSAIQRYHDSLDATTAPDVRTLSRQLAEIHVQEELWRRYRDYHTAVLTPGLSPAQRRLLFGAAQRDLEKDRLQAMD